MVAIRWHNGYVFFGDHPSWREGHAGSGENYCRHVAMERKPGPGPAADPRDSQGSGLNDSCGGESTLLKKDRRVERTYPGLSNWGIRPWWYPTVAYAIRSVFRSSM